METSNYSATANMVEHKKFKNLGIYFLILLLLYNEGITWNCDESTSQAEKNVVAKVRQDKQISHYSQVYFYNI